MEAQSQKRILQLERQWLKTDLIILDEVGFVPLSRTGAELLFQFCAARYEKGSMIITSNLEFTEWTQIFKESKWRQLWLIGLPIVPISLQWTETVIALSRAFKDRDHEKVTHLDGWIDFCHGGQFFDEHGGQHFDWHSQIIDEIGYLPFDNLAANLFFQVVSAR